MTYIDDLATAIRTATPDRLVPEEDDLDDLFRIYAVLGLVKGLEVTTKDVHDAWSAWMLNRGEGHESIVPFDALDADTQAEDEPFVKAIHTALRS